MRKEGRISRRVVEVRSSVTPNSVVTPSMHTHAALSKFSLVDGLKRCDISIILDQAHDFVVGGGVSGLERDVAAETAWVVAEAISLRVLGETTGNLEHGLEWSMLVLKLQTFSGSM